MTVVPSGSAARGVAEDAAVFERDEDVALVVRRRAALDGRGGKLFVPEVLAVGDVHRGQERLAVGAGEAGLPRGHQHLGRHDEPVEHAAPGFLPNREAIRGLAARPVDSPVSAGWGPTAPAACAGSLRSWRRSSAAAVGQRVFERDVLAVLGK